MKPDTITDIPILELDKNAKNQLKRVAESLIQTPAEPAPMHSQETGEMMRKQHCIEASTQANAELITQFITPLLDYLSSSNGVDGYFYKLMANEEDDRAAGSGTLTIYIPLQNIRARKDFNFAVERFVEAQGITLDLEVGDILPGNWTRPVTHERLVEQEKTSQIEARQ